MVDVVTSLTAEWGVNFWIDLVWKLYQTFYCLGMEFEYDPEQIAAIQNE